MIALECPNCKLSLQIPDEYAGKAGNCRQCGAPVVVPISGANKACPFCSSVNPAEATECKQCGEWFRKSDESSDESVASQPPPIPPIRPKGFFGDRAIPWRWIAPTAVLVPASLILASLSFEMRGVSRLDAIPSAWGELVATGIVAFLASHYIIKPRFLKRIPAVFSTSVLLVVYSCYLFISSALRVPPQATPNDSSTLARKNLLSTAGNPEHLVAQELGPQTHAIVETPKPQLNQIQQQQKVATIPNATIPNRAIPRLMVGSLYKVANPVPCLLGSTDQVGNISTYSSTIPAGGYFRVQSTIGSDYVVELSDGVNIYLAGVLASDLQGVSLSPVPDANAATFTPRAPLDEEREELETLRDELEDQADEIEEMRANMEDDAATAREEVEYQRRQLEEQYEASRQELENIQQSTRNSVPARGAMQSNVNGDFEGWEGDTVVILANGQIWKQTDFRYEYHYAFRPTVVVYRDGARYKMFVEGCHDAVAVERLK